MPGNTSHAVHSRRNAAGANALARGFTLVELMIVVVLVSTLLGLGVPLFRDFIKDQRARTTSSDLSIALMLARSEAIKRNDTVTLEPANDGDDWSVGWTIASPVDGEPDILNHVQPGEISITEASDLEQVRFSSAGRALDLAVFEINVDTEANDMCRVVTLALDGQTTSKKEDCTDGG